MGNLSLDVPCEIQVRTLLQDAWAQLSRADLYRSDIPKSLVKQFAAMAESIARADEIAEEVRVEITKPAPGKEPSADAIVSAESLAFIYERAFKEEPPVYLVEWMLKRISDAKVRADVLDAKLQDRDFLKSCQKEYERTTRWPPDPSRQFEWAIEFLLGGKEKALAKAREHGQADWDDIDAQCRSDMCATIPNGWDEFEVEAEDGTLDVLEVGRYFDVVRECMCGEEMIEFEDFVEAVTDHYGLRGDEAHTAYNSMLDILNASGIKDADGSSLCNYHTHLVNKDD